MRAFTGESSAETSTALRSGVVRWWPTVICAALSIADLAFASWSIPGWRSVPALIACAALTLRRSHPLEATLTAFGAQLLFELAAGSNDHSIEVPGGQSIAGAVLIYSLCRWLTPRPVAIGLASVTAMVFVGELTDGATPADGVTLADNVFFVVPWLIVGLLALAMRYRARLIEAQHEQVRLGERNALARDLHDTVAHHISAIAVQAQAAKFVADANPTAAKEAVGTIEDIANTALDEMRQMVGILRSDSDEARSVIPATLDALARPSDSPPVRVVGQTDLSELPAAVAGAVYRIAREAITNAGRHNDNVGVIEATVTGDGQTVVLDVVNDGTPTSRARGSGYGLIGMTERAEALGGTLESGIDGASGWRVRATIPLAPPR